MRQRFKSGFAASGGLSGVAVLLLLGFAGCGGNQAELERLQMENRRLQDLQTENEALKQKLANNAELIQLRKDKEELVSLRNEVRQLRASKPLVEQLQTEVAQLRVKLEQVQQVQAESLQQVAQQAQAAQQKLMDAQAAAQMNACLANLKSLDGAKAIWALEHKKTDNDTPLWEELVGEQLYLRDMPACPAGGKYTLNPVSLAPTCSIEGHVMR